MAGIGHVKACHSVYDAERKVYAADYDDGSYGQGCQIIHAYVGNVAQYQRQYQFADRCEGGAEQIHYHDSYVVPVVGDKSFKQCTCFHIVYVYILYVYSFLSAKLLFYSSGQRAKRIRQRTHLATAVRFKCPIACSGYLTAYSAMCRFLVYHKFCIFSIKKTWLSRPCLSYFFTHFHKGLRPRSGSA